MTTSKTINKEKRLRTKLLSEMTRLATSAFGLVAALAWNDLIKEFMAIYIKPFLGDSSAIASLAIYAVLVTLLAVLVTYYLARLTHKD